MNFHWINNYVEGIEEYCSSRDPAEICRSLDIEICRMDPKSFLLKGTEAIYLRSYLSQEIIFISNDLPYLYEKYVLAHELGHAILHPDIDTAAYSSKLLNKGKLERQANYFAPPSSKDIQQRK
jgi:Zn-dependent peptidase ImmA (M78 family)